ncbi:FMN-binding protein [Dactylosporangium cerinum]|uniref:FMN-binding protein n=1 Tax=Dactylosporangium cerinum TaxID=1434730 RepID=A0ABV9VM90_9ACTN
MRRAMIALIGTAAGTVLLVSAKAGFSSPTDRPLNPQAAGATGPVPSGSVPPPSGGPAPAGTMPPGNGGATTTTTTAAPPAGGATKTTSAPKPTTAAPKPPRTTMKDGTFGGSSVYVEYGNVEVSIVVSGGKITDVKVLDSPSDHSRSVQINKTALPKLRSEALSAQSANIDTVSGATYTSSGYKLSLQAAIDRAFQA